MANMIYEEHLMVVEDGVIAAKFKERYTIELPLPFIRQVFGGACITVVLLKTMVNIALL